VLALTVLCLAALLDTVDVTVVNVALPAIKTSLGFSEGGLAWVVNAYMVAFGGFLLFGGRTGDLLGRRRVLVAGTVLFTVASVGSALAVTSAMLIMTRAAEGLAAAFVVPMTLAMLGSVFPAGPARNRAFAIWGGMSAAAGTLGLIAGGLLVSAAGWRWIFFINIPVGALVLAGAFRLLPRDLPRSAAGGFDLIGAISVTAGATLLAFGVVRHSWVIALLSLAPLGYFVAHERFFASSPLMPLSMWRDRSVSGANIVSALMSSASFAMFYSTTLYMQLVLHYSALRTGLSYVPFGLAILVAAGATPQVVRLAGVRIATAAGSLVATAGLIWLAHIPASGHLLTDIILPTIVIGAGGGIVILATTIAAMAGAPASRHGVASSLLNVSRQLGGAIGLAVISSVITSVTDLTGGFRVGFAVSAALLAVAAVVSATLLPSYGRGQLINPLDLQAAGEQTYINRSSLSRLRVSRTMMRFLADDRTFGHN
jgi:EmrB/QacA subfamily drug resistance transporter